MVTTRITFFQGVHKALLNLCSAFGRLRKQLYTKAEPHATENKNNG